MKKISNINDHKKPKKALTAEEIAKRAYRKHFKAVKPEDEPQGLASGKTTQRGSFVNDDDKDE